MRLPNGYGSVYKLSGKRRKPYVAMTSHGIGNDGKVIRQRVKLLLLLGNTIVTLPFSIYLR